MEHKDIAQIVNSMEIFPLTKDTFENFVQGVNGLFVPKGARFREFFSAGHNPRSKDKYDFSKGKPEYKEYEEGRVLIFDKVELKEIPKENKKWINVYFENDLAGVWGIRANLPLRVGFDPERAIYIADQEYNGTPEHPWEEVYIKI